MKTPTVPIVRLDYALAKVVVQGLPDRPGSAAALFHELAEANLFAETIVENTGREGVSTLTLTLPESQRLTAYELIRRALAKIKSGQIMMHGPIAKLTVTGFDAGRQGIVAARLFEALAQAGVNIDMISTSEALITIVVYTESANEALAVAKRAFESEAPQP